MLIRSKETAKQWQKRRTDTLAELLGKTERQRDDLLANVDRLTDYIANHHTLELDTEAALLVAQARTAARLVRESK